MKVTCRLFSSLVLTGALVLHPPSQAIAQDGALPAKPPGVIRIGLVLPKVQLGTNEAAQAAEGVRNMFAEYLNGPTIQVALLSARIPSQFAVEAQQAECDYTLSATVVHRRGNDNAALGRVLGNFSGYIPVGDAVQGAIVSGVIQTASDFASSTQAKDVMQLDYQLQVPGSSKPLLSQSTKSRARTDGEDLLTPLIEQAAEAVGAEISRR